MKITIKEKSVYGRSLWYPMDENAKGFATLLNQKTIFEHQFALIKKLGFKIEQIPL